jgi:hypothetical protein
MQHAASAGTIRGAELKDAREGQSFKFHFCRRAKLGVTNDAHSPQKMKFEGLTLVFSTPHCTAVGPVNSVYCARQTVA